MNIRVYKGKQNLGFFNKLQDISKTLSKKDLQKASIFILNNNKLQIILAKRLISILY